MTRYTKNLGAWPSCPQGYAYICRSWHPG